MTAPILLTHPRTPFSGDARLSRRATLAATSLGVGAILAAWALAASSRPELVLPSPGQTAIAVVDLWTDGTLASNLTITLLRAAVGVVAAICIGSAWGILNGVSPWAASISRPAVAALLALPPIMLVALGLTWFGPGAATTRLVIILVALPLIVISVQEAVAGVDQDLAEMVAVFDVPRWRVLRDLIIPAVSSPVLAAITVALGQAVRVAVMAELFSAADGVGADIGRARTNLETADLFAWAIVLIATVLAVELLIVRPITRRALRWRKRTS